MPAIAERLPAKYLVKVEAPKIIASREDHEAYIQRLVELQRKGHRTVEETETNRWKSLVTASTSPRQYFSKQET